MSDKKLYEVQVGYHDDEAGKDRWLGVWTGIASSDKEARALAHESEWDARLDSASLSAVYTTRMKPRFVVAEHWGHIFVGEQESATRWVYDRLEERLAGAEIQTAGRWSNLDAAATADLLESIRDNDAEGSPADFGLEETDVLPQWAGGPAADATEASPTRRRPKP